MRLLLHAYIFASLSTALEGSAITFARFNDFVLSQATDSCHAFSPVEFPGEGLDRPMYLRKYRNCFLHSLVPACRVRSMDVLLCLQGRNDFCLQKGQTVPGSVLFVPNDFASAVSDIPADVSKIATLLSRYGELPVIRFGPSWPSHIVEKWGSRGVAINEFSVVKNMYLLQSNCSSLVVADSGIHVSASSGTEGAVVVHNLNALIRSNFTDAVLYFSKWGEHHSEDYDYVRAIANASVITDAGLVMLHGGCKVNRGDVFSISYPWGNFQHYIFDVLPKLYTHHRLQRIYRGRGEELQLLSSSYLFDDPIHVDFVHLLDIRQVKEEADACYDRIFFAGFISGAKEPPSNEYKRWLVSLRTKLNVSNPTEASAATRKLFLTRDDAEAGKGRSVTNIDELKKALVMLGFELLTMRDFPSISERLSLFQTAAVIVVEYGAGLSNIVFMPRGIILVSLSSNYYADNTFDSYGFFSAQSNLLHIAYCDVIADMNKSACSTAGCPWTVNVSLVSDAVACVNSGVKASCTHRFCSNHLWNTPGVGLVSPAET